MNWETVIGLEVHAQLLTESKLFCACSTRFGDPPNANSCPVCSGLPGVLPVPNRKAVEHAIRLGLAVGCQIEPKSIWARKNYFYPDLPKGYQISMYEAPICTGGRIEFPHEGETSSARLVRIHMEEDAGKNVHDASPDSTLVDLNRAGIPLLEIVSEPDLRSAAEAGEYLRRLRSIVRYLEISDGNLEEGSFRCDANVSIRPIGETKLGTRTELKNLNSFRAVEKAIEHERDRQIDVLESGGSVVQETRLWDEREEMTRPMRSKEEAQDYRYFPDPDLPPLEVATEWVESVRRDLPELPGPRAERFQRALALSEYDAGVLTARRDLADYFEAAIAGGQSPKAVANWVTEAVLRLVHERRLDDALRIEAWPVSAAHLGELVGLVEDGTISGKIAKEVFEALVDADRGPAEIVRERGLEQVTDTTAIRATVESVLAEHEAKVGEYRAGKEKLFGFFVGQVMKATKGKANPKAVNEILRDLLTG